MRPWTRDRKQSAEKHYTEFWSRRPLAYWTRNALNKLLCRRIERRRLNRSVLRELAE